MSFTWPNYQDEALGDGRTWSGTFDSFDQRNDEVYYVITLHEGGRDLEPFMVAVATGWIGDGSALKKPDFVPKLRDKIALVAKAGKTNTDYTGSVLNLPR
jgi:hypothetical protein